MSDTQYSFHIMAINKHKRATENVHMLLTFIAEATHSADGISPS